MSAAPPPLLEHSSALRPPFACALPGKPINQPKTPEQQLASEIHTNIIGGVLFCAGIALVVWCGRAAGRAELFNQFGSVLLMLADLFFLVVITLEPILIRRGRNHPKPRAAASPAQPGFDPNPTRLQATNALFGLAGAGLVLTILVTQRTLDLGAAIMWSIFLLQFYRTLLLLLFVGGDAAWARMRKWPVKHWNDSEPLNDAG